MPLTPPLAFLNVLIRPLLITSRGLWPRCQQTERTHPCRLQTSTRETSVRSSSLMALVPRLDGLSGCSEPTCPRPTGRVQLVAESATLGIGSRGTGGRFSGLVSALNVLKLPGARSPLSNTCLAEESSANITNPSSPSSFLVLIYVAPALPHNSCPGNCARLCTLFLPSVNRAILSSNFAGEILPPGGGLVRSIRARGRTTSKHVLFGANRSDCEQSPIAMLLGKLFAARTGPLS